MNVIEGKRAVEAELDYIEEKSRVLYGEIFTLTKGNDKSCEKVEYYGGSVANFIDCVNSQLQDITSNLDSVYTYFVPISPEDGCCDKEKKMLSPLVENFNTIEARIIYIKHMVESIATNVSPDLTSDEEKDPRNDRNSLEDYLDRILLRLQLTHVLLDSTIDRFIEHPTNN